MVAHNCHADCKKFGTNRNGSQRYRCLACGKTFTAPQEKPLEEMTVNHDKAILALKMLVEGNSIRSVERITDLHRDTIIKLLVLAGEKCEKVIGRRIRNGPCSGRGV